MSHSNNNNLINICILRLSSIGDITHIIPIIKSLQHALPNSNITWIIGKTEYSLVKNLNGVKFIIFDKSHNLKSILQLLSALKAINFDILLHMQKSLRSKFISNFIKYKRKVVYDASDKGLKLHVLDSFFKFLDKIDISEKVFDWSLNIPDSKNLIPNVKDYIVFNPFTSSRRFNYREWNIENYIEISEYVYKKYSLKSIMVGGHTKYELDESKKIKGLDFIYNNVGQSNLQELYNIIKSSRIYIGPDSGTLHIASMLNIPVIGLYATSNPHRTGPYNNQQYIINKYDEALRKYMNCSQENIKWGGRVRNKDAMTLISKKDVINKIDLIMD